MPLDDNQWVPELVNTRVLTHAQIHIYAQITTHAQITALFQPYIPSQPSTHLHHNQVPCPATISILSQSTTHHLNTVSLLPSVTKWPCSALWSYMPWQLEAAHSRRLITWHQFPFVSYPFLPSIPVSTSLTLVIPIYLTLGHVTFLVRIIIHL